MTDKEQKIIDGVNVSGCEYVCNTAFGNIGCKLPFNKEIHCCNNPNCHFKQLKHKEQEYQELEDKMADVIYAATGGRLSYSNYTLDAIEQAFNHQLEILSDQKVEEETKELNQKLYLAQNEIHSKTEYIQEQREEIKDLEKKLKIAIEALKDIYDKADEIYFDQYRTSLFCKQVRGISIQALEELE